MSQVPGRTRSDTVDEPDDELPPAPAPRAPDVPTRDIPELADEELPEVGDEVVEPPEPSPPPADGTP